MFEYIDFLQISSLMILLCFFLLSINGVRLFLTNWAKPSRERGHFFYQESTKPESGM